MGNQTKSNSNKRDAARLYLGGCGITSADKPPNWIPRDGLLARAVRLFRTEGHSQSNIARELRLNRRTVSRLCAGEIDVELRSFTAPACAAEDIENYLIPIEDSSAEKEAPEQPQAFIVKGFGNRFLGRKRWVVP
jgi:hypothetical protein